MAGLRDFFGVWERCGGSSFWRMTYPQRTGMAGLYVDPIDFVMVYVHEHPQVGGPAVEIRTTAPAQEGHDDWRAAVQALPAHMRTVYEYFTSALLFGWSVRDWGKEDMLRWFLESYKKQGRPYEEGTERADDFLEPAREEVLTAVKKVLGNIGAGGRRERRVVLKEDLEEALVASGVPEC